MSHPFADPRASNILHAVQELIHDKESNDVILMSIRRFFSLQSAPDYSPLINDRQFVYQLFFHFLKECLQTEPTGQMTVNERQLSQRAKVMSQFVYNYREFQLSLLLVLSEIKVALGLSDDLFEVVIKILHSNGVVSDDGFNHWTQCKQDFERRITIVQNCLKLLDWSQEAREDYFFETNVMTSVGHY